MKELNRNFWKGMLCLFLGEAIIWAFIIMLYKHNLSAMQGAMFVFGFMLIILIIAGINKGLSIGVVGMICASIFPIGYTLATLGGNPPHIHNPKQSIYK